MRPFPSKGVTVTVRMPFNRALPTTMILPAAKRDQGRRQDSPLRIHYPPDRGNVGATRSMGIVIVTGGSRGIGAAVARMAASRGHDVVINYHSRADAAEAVAADVRNA